MRRARATPSELAAKLVKRHLICTTACFLTRIGLQLDKFGNLRAPLWVGWTFSRISEKRYVFKKRLIPTSTKRTEREVMESPSVPQTDFTRRAGTPETSGNFAQSCFYKNRTRKVLQRY